MFIITVDNSSIQLDLTSGKPDFIKTFRIGASNFSEKKNRSLTCMCTISFSMNFLGETQNLLLTIFSPLLIFGKEPFIWIELNQCKEQEFQLKHTYFLIGWKSKRTKKVYRLESQTLFHKNFSSAFYQVFEVQTLSLFFTFYASFAGIKFFQEHLE